MIRVVVNVVWSCQALPEHSGRLWAKAHMQGAFLTRDTGGNMSYRNLFAADFIEKHADPFPVMETAKPVLWISTSQSVMDLLYQCPESCTDQGLSLHKLLKTGR